MGGEGKTAFGLHFKVKFTNMNKVNYHNRLQYNKESSHTQTVPAVLPRSAALPPGAYNHSGLKYFCIYWFSEPRADPSG